MSTVLAIVGLIGLTSIIEGVRWLARWAGAQAFLRLTVRGPVDVVLSPARSAEVPERAAGDRFALRLGNLRAVAGIARAIGSVSARKEIRVHVSDAVDGRLHEDLLLVGSSAANPVFARFIQHLNRANPGLGVVFDERVEHRNTMGIGGRRWTYDWRREAASRVLERDIGLIVVWDNPFARQPRRALLCAAFTATGNAALTDHLLERLAPQRRLGNLFRRPRFAQIVELRFLNGTLDEVQPLSEAIALRPPAAASR